MGKKEKFYSEDFKTRAVRLCEASKKSISEVARELGVKYQTLYQWMRDAGKTKAVKRQDRVRRNESGGARAHRSGALPGETAEEEVRRLRRELEEARLERDFLKKAVAFFARDEK